MPTPADHYHSRLTLHQAALQKLTKHIFILSRLRLLAALAALSFAVAAFNAGSRPEWAFASAMAITFLVLVRRHTRSAQQEQLLQIRTGLLKGEQSALDGNYNAFPMGEAYTDSSHPYSFDLDLFGEGSVYQMLCRCTTRNGAAALAGLLMQPPMNRTQIANRQQMILELGTMPVFLEDFRAEGAAVAEEAGDDVLVRHWLTAPEYFINNALAKTAVILLPALAVGLIIYSLVIGTAQAGIGVVVAATWMTLRSFGSKIKAANLQVGRTARLVEKYQRLQSVTALASFRHPQLAAIAVSARQASAQIIRFRELANMFDSRNNGLAGPLLNSLFLFDIYCLLQLERWRRKHRTLLLRTMEAMEALDVLVSCANYAFNHPQNTYPVFDTESIEAADLRHPLLAKDAVGNDCTLGGREKIYLLTGANMTGKSTFIRTIGTVAVLSYTGMPVPARALSLPLMRIYTAIRITDSIQNDVSYFRAELNRIKALMDTVQSSGDLFLILLDEPLRGTNSGDKQLGTRSVIEKLLRQNMIGIVATHDIGLCSLQQEYPGEVSNYHFESAVTPKGLVFDFKLRPGGSTSNNATILMRQMGIID